MPTKKCPIQTHHIDKIKSGITSLDAMTSLPWTPYYVQKDAILPDPSSPDDIGFWILASTVAFVTLVFSFENYLNFRQSTAYSRTDFPKELETTVTRIDSSRKRQKPTTTTTTEEKETETKADDEEILPKLRSKFEKAQAYGRDKVSFAIFSETYELFETVAFLLLGFLPYMWDMAARIGANGTLYWTIEGEIGISLIFLGLTTIVGMVTGLPFELYSTFRIEKKHGFNKTTLSLFVSDKIKGLLLTMIIGGPFTALLLKIIKWGGDYFYLYVWAFTFAFSLFMMTIVPVFIMPLFNKYEPLPEGQLKDAINALAKRIKYPLKKLFVMDGSKRSSHSNAFMFGFGNNKRIVLFDTLMEQVEHDEILAILGHELGHWKLGHTLMSLAITQTYFGAAFYIFSLCYQNAALYGAFGFAAPPPTIIALLLFFQTIWAPVDKVLSFATTILSRHNEFAADKFSVDLDMSAALQRGLCKIHLENLGSMCPDWLYSTYHYSHPPLVERLGAMMELDKKKK